MRKPCAWMLVLALVGCASASGSRPTSQQEVAKATCSRFVAAVRASADVFNPIKMQHKAIEDCGRGNGYACISVPVAIPYTALLAVVGVPLLTPILMASDNVQRRACPPQPGTRPTGGD